MKGEYDFKYDFKSEGFSCYFRTFVILFLVFIGILPVLSGFIFLFARNSIFRTKQ